MIAAKKTRICNQPMAVIFERLLRIFRGGSGRRPGTRPTARTTKRQFRSRGSSIYLLEVVERFDVEPAQREERDAHADEDDVFHHGRWEKHRTCQRSRGCGFAARRRRGGFQGCRLQPGAWMRPAS